MHFHFEKSFPLKNRRRLRIFIKNLIGTEKKKLTNLNYIFCSDKALLEINRKYLAHDFYTDIITFDLSSSPNEILADVYISVDRVKENATRLKLSFREELHRVMFHGVLHLCGYEDQTQEQQIEIRTKEDYYLSRYLH